jgi:hypothetical protein
LIVVQEKGCSFAKHGYHRVVATPSIDCFVPAEIMQPEGNQLSDV